jgi:hypothetical protein
MVRSALFHRTGLISTFNLIPLFLLASRNNPLILSTGISFETCNLLHRWLGRIVVIEAVFHGSLWFDKVLTQGKHTPHRLQTMSTNFHLGGANAVAAALKHSSLILSGTIALCAFVTIMLQSPSAIRRAYYEIFLHIHIILAALAVAAVWVHMDRFTYQKIFVQFAFAIWMAERSLRILRLLYWNFGSGISRAEIEFLPGSAIRINISMARSWKFQPGQHVYVYFPSLCLWMNHPFSVAWSDKAISQVEEKDLRLPRQDSANMDKITLIVRGRKGLTKKLHDMAQKSSTGKFSTIALCEGPYSKKKFHSYGTVLLFATGSGITYALPHVLYLVNGFSNKTVATRKIILFWIIKELEHFEWIRDWICSILKVPGQKTVLTILVFITQPHDAALLALSSNMKILSGRPDVPVLIDYEVEHSIGAIMVSVCGIGSLASEIRDVCTAYMSKVSLTFAHETFSW